MFVITNRIPVAPGHEADFENRFRHRAHLIDQSPGFIKNLVMRPVQRRFNHQTGQWEDKAEQGYYLVQTYWETEQCACDILSGAFGITKVLGQSALALHWNAVQRINDDTFWNVDEQTGCHPTYSNHIVNRTITICKRRGSRSQSERS